MWLREGRPERGAVFESALADICRILLVAGLSGGWCGPKPTPETELGISVSRVGLSPFTRGMAKGCGTNSFLAVSRSPRLP